MRLTKKKAIAISIELWEWLAETGEEYKCFWSGWDKYGDMANECALCEYRNYHGGYRILANDKKECPTCPYYAKYGECEEKSSPYHRWREGKSKVKRKKYATQFLEQLKQL